MSRVKEETVQGAKWLMLQKLTLQPLQFVYGVILARLITPEEMGIIGLTVIFFSVATCLASSGFGAAIIRKLDRTDADCNTMFWFNLAMNMLMALILFSLAPWFVGFYRQPELLWLTRCSALLMLLSGSAGVHWALYSARRDFKTPSIIQAAGAIAAMPVGVFLAYQGYGVWALMGQQVTSTLISCGAVWVVSPWKPRFAFSLASFRNLFSYGSKLAASSLIHVVYAEMRTFIIGRYYSAADLGLFTKGTRLAALLPSTFSGMVGTVSFPVLATLQNDLARLAGVYRTYIRTATLPIAWVSITIAALATPLVSFLYGEMWLPCVFFVQTGALAYSFDHICGINLNLLYVLGRTDLVLRLEVVKKTVSILMLLYAATISVEAICWAMVIYTQLAIVCNSYYTGKFISHNWWQQQKDYLPFFILAAVASAPGYFLAMFTELPDLLKLALGGMSSFAIYFGYLAFRGDEALKQYLSILMKRPVFRKLAAKLGVFRFVSPP